MKKPAYVLLPMAMLINLLAMSALWGQSSTRSASPVVQRGFPSQGGVNVQQPVYRAPQGTIPYGRPNTVIQQGSSTRQVQPGTVIEAARPQTFEQKLWRFIINGKYRNWAPVPGKSDAMYEGQSPHGAHLKMYLNRKAAGSPKTLPSKSIVIKENYGPDQKTLMAITVMYRSAGYNAAAGDWYWVKYLPNGQVDQKDTPTGRMRMAGKVGGCIECHSDADGGDYAFFNDDL